MAGGSKATLQNRICELRQENRRLRQLNRLMRDRLAGLNADDLLKDMGMMDELIQLANTLLDQRDADHAIKQSLKRKIQAYQRGETTTNEN